MPRKLLIKSDQFPYHVTGRVNNKAPFPIPLENMWEIITFECLVAQTLFGIQIHALVLMPNHFHLILSTPKPEYSLNVVMNVFMSAVTRSCHRRSGHSGRLFGGRYFWSLVLSSRYYGHVLKYVYRNPVKAGLCERVEEYEFSTIRGLIGQNHLPFPLSYSGFELNIPDSNNRTEWLNWLNQPFPKEAEVLIQKLLKRKTIKVFIDPNRKKPSQLLENLI